MGFVKRGVKLAGYAWKVLGITLVGLLFLEVGLDIAFWVKDGIVDGRGQGQVDPRSRADGYGQAEWVAEYFREYLGSYRTHWEPYVYWRRVPFEGRYVNIDERGIRRTANAPHPGEGIGESTRIFMFGGSTLWGTGARDDYTIPSYVSRELEAQGFRVEVTNFGEAGYVSTQEVIALLRQLQEGNIPDLVVCYDGANDVYSTYQQGRGGRPQNEFQREREFNLTRRYNYGRLLPTTSRARSLSVGTPGARGRCSAWRCRRAFTRSASTPTPSIPSGRPGRQAGCSTSATPTTGTRAPAT